MKKNIEQICPCGSRRLFQQCCGLFISGVQFAATAEQLMRSRYTAFAIQNESYLLSTWHPSSRPSSVNFDSEQKWSGLKILSTKAGIETDQTGEVEFIARYKINGKAHKLHETSRFRNENGIWYYFDGDHN